MKQSATSPGHMKNAMKEIFLFNKELTDMLYVRLYALFKEMQSGCSALHVSACTGTTGLETQAQSFLPSMLLHHILSISVQALFPCVVLVCFLIPTNDFFFSPCRCITFFRYFYLSLLACVLTLD